VTVAIVVIIYNCCLYYIFKLRIQDISCQ